MRLTLSLSMGLVAAALAAPVSVASATIINSYLTKSGSTYCDAFVVPSTVRETGLTCYARTSRSSYRVLTLKTHGRVALSRAEAVDAQYTLRLDNGRHYVEYSGALEPRSRRDASRVSCYVTSTVGIRCDNADGHGFVASAKHHKVF